MITQLTAAPSRAAIDATDNPWLHWRLDTEPQPQLLTVAELAECACPDLCHRDHGND